MIQKFKNMYQLLDIIEFDGTGISGRICEIDHVKDIYLLKIQFKNKHQYEAFLGYLSNKREYFYEHNLGNYIYLPVPFSQGVYFNPLETFCKMEIPFEFLHFLNPRKVGEVNSTEFRLEHHKLAGGVFTIQKGDSVECSKWGGRVIGFSHENPRKVYVHITRALSEEYSSQIIEDMPLIISISEEEILRDILGVQE